MIDYISCTEDGSTIRLYDSDEFRPVCESNDIAELANAYLKYGIATTVMGSSDWFEAPFSTAREHIMKKVYEII
jgi:hypothetical protein